MDISPLLPTVKASSVPLAQLAGNPNISEKDKVTEACRQFEAILLKQILSESRKPVIKVPGEEDSNQKEIYNDMINTQLADSISRSGSFGLAKALDSRLVRQALPKGEAPAGPVAPPPMNTKHH